MKYQKIVLMLPGLVLLIGLSATYLLQRSALESERRFQQEEFATTAQEIKRSIERRLAAYEIVLHGARGLFKGSANVDRFEFREYVEALELGKHYPGIQGVGYSRIVPARELDGHIASLRKEGFSGYTIYPDGKRDPYTAISFLEPLDARNQRALGYDMYSEPTHRAAMERARDSDESAMSGKVTLTQEGGQEVQTGCLMYLPVYRNGQPHKTLAERRANIQGWVYSPYRMNDLMLGALGERVKNISLTIYDGRNVTPQGLIYSNRDMAGQAPGIYESSLQINFADHVWTARLQSLHSFDEIFDVARVRQLQVSGTLITLMLTLLTWLLLSGRSHALRLAQAMTHDLRESESALKEAQAISGLGSFFFDVKNLTWNSSEQMNRLFGIDDTFVRSLEGWIGLIHPEDRAMMERYWADEVLGKGMPFDHEYRIIRHDDLVERWVHGLGKLEFDARGEVVSMRGTIQDITERKLSEENIQRLAFFDPLTLLPNRRLLMDRLKQAVAVSARGGHQGALLFIDLDNFKTINDTLGHDTGDMLLQLAAQRLVSCVLEGDTVARLGGDEFMVMLEDLNLSSSGAAIQAETVCEKILAALGQSYRIGSHELRSTPSIGATLFGSAHVDKDELIKQADIAMYQAKRSGRNTVCFFDPVMQATIVARATQEADLRHAILEQDQLHLYYQAQVDSSGHIIGAEALVRWIHPTKGMISPAQFIPLAEESGLILPLGHWVLATACRQLAAWATQPESAHLTMAVNTSARQFLLPTFVEEVMALVDYFKIDPAKLKLEITESMLLHNVDEIIAKMTALKARGINFSMDDFGTGYSSLQYLKRLPLDQLKIDQSFVRDIVSDESDRAIVRTIIAMAKSLELKIIAEGVETEEQRRLLLRKGCRHFQGYLFGRPMPIEQFEASLGL